MSTIYLVRHCRYANPRNILPGRLPLDLSAEGWQEAELLHRFFTDHPIQKIYSSAVLRCQQTSEKVAQNSDPSIPIMYDRRLLETFSSYQGYWNQWAWQDFVGHRQELGGELYKDIYDRMSACWNDIVAQENSDLMICSHGDPLYFLYEYLAGIPLDPEYVPGDEVIIPINYQEKGSIRPIQVGADKKVVKIEPIITVAGLRQRYDPECNSDANDAGSEMSNGSASWKAQQRVYALVRQVPEGKVVTYGDIALALGLSTPRSVGRYLHQNPELANAPCHRVVFADGALAPEYAFGGAQVQRERLESEGVHFTTQGKVELTQSRWTPSLV